jgi:hypothetical protein
MASAVASPAASAAPADSLPFELRVLALEARVSGVPPLGAPAPPHHAESSKSAVRRLHDLRVALERAGQGSEPLKRFVANCACADNVLASPALLALIALTARR